MKISSAVKEKGLEEYKTGHGYMVRRQCNGSGGSVGEVSVVVVEMEEHASLRL